MRYIQYFKTAAEEQAAIDNKELGKPYVAYLEDEQRIDWNTNNGSLKKVTATYNVTSTTEPTMVAWGLVANSGRGDDSFVVRMELEDGTPLETGRFVTFPQTGKTKVVFYVSGTSTPYEMFYHGLQDSGLSDNLVEVVVGEGLTTVFGGFCYNMTNLTSVTLSSTVTSLSGGCFVRCPITTITLPSGLTEVGNNCFYRTNLSEIISYAPVAPSLSTLSLTEMPGTGTIYKPAGSDYSTWLEKLGSGWTAVDL